MKLYLRLAFLFLVISSNIVNAQIRCNTELPENTYIPQNNLNINRSDEPFIIPVIVHVYNVNNFIPVTTGVVLECIELANNYFSGNLPNVNDVQPEFQSVVSNPNIQVKLATKLPDSSCFNGIIYYNLESYFDTPSDFSEYSIDTEHYLNIHIAVTDFSSATFPTPALIAGNPNDFILLTNFDARLRQYVLVHELGHWVGLGHTFGPANSSGISCNDDGIADTPPTKGSVGGTCNLTLSECTPGVIENVNNFMDYSNCPLMFTAGQSERMSDVVSDTNLARHQIGTPENIQRTGVFVQPYCEGEITTYNDQFRGCDSTLIRLYAMYSGFFADSVSWYCPGATQELWLTDHPYVYYPSEGVKTAYFSVCRDGVCNTIEHTFFADIVEPSLSLPFTSFPFSEDFESDFSFPQTNMVLDSDDLTPWQVCNFAGYNSENCLYIPAMFNSEIDTTSVLIGAFDFTQLNNVLVTAKVAVSAPENGSYCIFEIVLRNPCNFFIPSGAYLVLPINEINEGNLETNFVPTNSTQWHDIQFTWPNWTGAASAELELRVRYFPLTPGNTPEAFYLDNITVGELDVITQTNEIQFTDFDLFPNPVTDQLSIKLTSNKSESFKIFSPLGSLVQEGTIDNNNSISLQHLNAGIYFIQINNMIKRFVKIF
jgi:hypothetical protein